MKRAALITIAILAAQAATLAHAKAPTYNVLLAGGEEANVIAISVSPDGRNYLIDSVVPLEVGGAVCAHPYADETELVCPTSSVRSFEVNADGGDDRVTVSKSVPAPVTLRGGGGEDWLAGGHGPDMLIGGQGEDVLLGNGGADLLYGMQGADRLLGGWGDDVLRGGSETDAISAGPGVNDVKQ